MYRKYGTSEMQGASFRRMYRRYGTSEMQGDIGLSKCQQFGISPRSRHCLWRWPVHIFDACTGSTVRRKCRVISVFHRYHAIASGDGRSIFSRYGFAHYLLFGLKNQGARCFCSGYNWFIDSASYKRPFTMLYFTLSVS